MSPGFCDSGVHAGEGGDGVSPHGALLLCPLVEELWEPWAKCPAWEEGPNTTPFGTASLSPYTCHEPPSMDISRHVRVEEGLLAWTLCSFPSCLQPAFPASHLTVSPPADPAPGTIHCPRNHHRLPASAPPPPWNMLFPLLGMLLLAWSSRTSHSLRSSWSHLLREALHK